MASTGSFPHLTVLGLYSPVSNLSAYNAFVEGKIQERDPANYSAEDREFHARRGRQPKPISEADRQAIWEEYEATLARAVLIEVLAESLDERFNAGDFVQPDTSVREDLRQCAWQETYLSQDGKTVISGYPSPEVPKAQTFRVAFYIHRWRRRLGLLSSYGPLHLPRTMAMPQRLWQLMPYEWPG